MGCKFNPFLSRINSSERGFTLLELIIVIVIVGILAAVGLNQYSSILRKIRIGEAKTGINLMRKLTQEYYLKNGAWSAITNTEVGCGTELPTSCRTTNYFYYYVSPQATYVRLYAMRCTAGGKSPNVDVRYYVRGNYYPNTGSFSYTCYDYATAASFVCP